MTRRTGLKKATERQIEKLPEMKATELRDLVRKEKLPITYLAQRDKPSLVTMIEAELRARG